MKESPRDSGRREFNIRKISVHVKFVHIYSAYILLYNMYIFISSAVHGQTGDFDNNINIILCRRYTAVVIVVVIRRPDLRIRRGGDGKVTRQAARSAKHNNNINLTFNRTSRRRVPWF